MKRSRRGGRRPQNGSGGHSGIGGSGSSGGGYNPNRVYDSNGPEVKIRGTASHVYEKYLQLARDANVSGDRVMAENYLQHAEHYFRIMAVAQAQAQQYQAAATAPVAGAQPRLPTEGAAPVPAGMEEQPYVETQAMTSAPSFSLTEPSASEEDEEEESGEDEDVEAAVE